uniref:Predicted gene 20661 n=1 Tax=Mus musculus TaxID=10090 RepID=K7N787_MOUSE
MLLHHQALLYSSGWSSEKQAQHLCLRVAVMNGRIHWKQRKMGFSSSSWSLPGI